MTSYETRLFLKLYQHTAASRKVGKIFIRKEWKTCVQNIQLKEITLFTWRTGSLLKHITVWFGVVFTHCVVCNRNSGPN